MDWTHSVSDQDPNTGQVQPADPRARTYLSTLGGLADEAIDLSEAALHLALLRAPGTDLGPYRALLGAITETIGRRQVEGLEDRTFVLADVIANEYGFTGDSGSYDDIDNANLIRVLDRRKGLPITLSLVYLHVARTLGWPMHGIAFPGHFMVALDGAGGRVILDPFDGGATRGPQDLRALAKRMLGPDAELSPDHYASASNRAILSRLQNNIRSRLVQGGALEPAVQAIEALTWLNPRDAEAWRDIGIMHAELGRLKTAVRTLEQSLKIDDNASRRHVTAALIQTLRQRLN